MSEWIVFILSSIKLSWVELRVRWWSGSGRGIGDVSPVVWCWTYKIFSCRYTPRSAVPAAAELLLWTSDSSVLKAHKTDAQRPRIWALWLHVSPMSHLRFHCTIVLHNLNRATKSRMQLRVVCACVRVCGGNMITAPPFPILRPSLTNWMRKLWNYYHFLFFEFELTLWFAY